jgi:uncharacterized membrane protein
VRDATNGWVERVRGALARDPGPQPVPRRVAQLGLGAALALAGIGHLTFGREEFRAQVPPWIPVDDDVVVLASGVVELGLAAGLLLARRRRVPVGWLAAAFFVAIFPGNVAQFTEGRDAFGLESDAARGIRLAFQPVLVAWALWSTQAWRAARRG